MQLPGIYNSLQKHNVKPHFNVYFNKVVNMRFEDSDVTLFTFLDFVPNLYNIDVDDHSWLNCQKLREKRPKLRVQGFDCTGK